jgi:hypothetical protein
MRVGKRGLAMRFRNGGAPMLALLVVCWATFLAGCGEAQPAGSAGASPSPAASSVADAWAAVSQLQAPLVDTVVVWSPGFNSAESTYLTRLNIIWSVAQDAAAEYATGSGDDGERAAELSETIEKSTSLWLKTKAPSAHFARMHRHARALLSQLQAMAQLGGQLEVSSDGQEQTRLSERIATLSLSLGAAADKVMLEAGVLRDRYGKSSLVDAGAGELTAAEVAQIEAIVQGSFWITAPLEEAQQYLRTPMPSWSFAEAFAFCLDMGFIENECDNWINTAPAGPRIAAAYNEYVEGLRLLREAAEQLITAAENLDYDAGVAGANHLNEAVPYVERAVTAFRILCPEAFTG